MSDLADFLSAQSKAQPMRNFEVPEWKDKDGKPVVIYHKQRSLLDAKKVARQSKGDDQAALVYTIINEALDKDGKPLFDVGDKAWLMGEVDPNIILGISMKICERKDDAELKKS
jgi:hypothetical protein